MSRKLAYGIVGDPDRLFLLPNGRVWWVEFKTPKGALTPRQRIVHEALAKAGHPVTVIRQLKTFKLLLDIHLGLTVD